MMEKAFVNFRHNSIHFNFPNGNQISAIWGTGTYSDNHDLILENGGFKKGGLDSFQTFMESDTVELMIACGDKLYKKLQKKYGADGVLTYLNMTEFMYVFDKVSKEVKK